MRWTDMKRGDIWANPHGYAFLIVDVSSSGGIYTRGLNQRTLVAISMGGLEFWRSAAVEDWVKVGDETAPHVALANVEIMRDAALSSSNPSTTHGDGRGRIGGEMNCEECKNAWAVGGCVLCGRLPARTPDEWIAHGSDVGPPMRGLTALEQWAIQGYLAEKYGTPPFRGVRCDFRLTAAQSAQVDQLIASVDHGSISGAIVVTERLGGYLVEPGGIVCTDWDGVLTAVRKAWGVA